jgi:putative isomerase
MKLDIREIPFSRFGSYFCISQEKDSGEIYLRDVHGGDDAPSKLFRLSLLENGVELEIDIQASETSIRLCSVDDHDKFAEIILPEEDEVHFYIKGVEVRLQANKVKYDTLHEYKDGMYEYHIYPKELKLMLISLSGDMTVTAPWNVIGNDYIDLRMNDGHFVIVSYRTVYREKDYSTFGDGKAKVESLYHDWHSSMLVENEIYRSSMERAAYITWSSIVHPDGILNEYAMYMSKLWMYNIWSWDNCFNALQLGAKYPELAYSQLKIFMDKQDESGVYPDFVNDKFVSYNCIKPPIFAYVYDKLMKRNDYFKDHDRLRLVYDSTKKVMAYFEHYRTYEGRLPHYKHGNDSGWDNASLFHQGMPVESPDLASFIIRTYDILSEFASILGEEAEANAFSEKADQLFELLMTRLYDQDGFFGRFGKAAEKIEIRSSLILRLPVLIGYRLENHVLEGLVTDLVEKFETKHGFATEMPSSFYYKEDGYWLGPIWAPVTYLFVDSLINNGYEEAGKRIRDKFLNLTLIGGMAENFDPLNGRGLVDTSFTWTSSVFLTLLEMKLAEE